MQTSAKSEFIWISAFIVWSASCTALFAAPCPEHVTAENWTKSFDGGQQARRDFLAQLRACLPGSEKRQQAVDDLAVDSLDALGSVAKDDQKSLADFVVEALRINAEVGFPSSQHNYAAMHNAEPGTLLQRLVPQDYPTFLYWTRRAAAQKEPRALFNLATRMADEAPPPGIAQDLHTAYAILAYLERSYRSKSLGLPPEVMAYVSKTKNRISNKLGADRTRKLDATLAAFDFSALAPAAKAP